MRRLALALLLAGCTSSSLKTATVLEVESKYRVGPMQQTCTAAQELIPIVNRLWPMVLQELTAEGIVTDMAGVEKKLAGARACLVEQPDTCPPSKPRKRGCAWAWGRYAWVSRHWPPICQPDYPDEPHCVAPGSPQSADFLADFAHELAELACQTVKADAHSLAACAAVARAVARYKGR